MVDTTKIQDLTLFLFGIKKFEKYFNYLPPLIKNTFKEWTLNGQSFTLFDSIAEIRKIVFKKYIQKYLDSEEFKQLKGTYGLQGTPLFPLQTVFEAITDRIIQKMEKVYNIKIDKDSDDNPFLYLCNEFTFTFVIKEDKFLKNYLKNFYDSDSEIERIAKEISLFFDYLWGKKDEKDGGDGILSVNTIKLKSRKISTRTFMISQKDENKKGYNCEQGYNEIKGILNIDEAFQNEMIIDVCAEVFNKNSSASDLKKIILEKPNKILDIYIWKDNSEWFKENGFEIPKESNGAFIHLDKKNVAEVFKEKQLKFEEIYE